MMRKLHSAVVFAATVATFGLAATQGVAAADPPQGGDDRSPAQVLCSGGQGANGGAPSLDGALRGVLCPKSPG